MKLCTESIYGEQHNAPHSQQLVSYVQNKIREADVELVFDREVMSCIENFLKAQGRDYCLISIILDFHVDWNVWHFGLHGREKMIWTYRVFLQQHQFGEEFFLVLLC